MGDISTVNKERIISEFIKLTSIDAPSYHENLIAGYIKEKHIPHRPLEILITTGEEPYCSGSRFIEYDRIRSKEGYVP